MKKTNEKSYIIYRKIFLMTLSGLQVTSFDCQSVAVPAPLSPNVLNTIWNFQNTADTYHTKCNNHCGLSWQLSCPKWVNVWGHWIRRKRLTNWPCLVNLHKAEINTLWCLCFPPVALVLALVSVVLALSLALLYVLGLVFDFALVNMFSRNSEGFH